MSGKRSRNKGLQYERDTANFFKSLGYKEALRNVTETQFGQGIDLVNTGVFDVQCKRYKDYAPISKINEVPVVDGRIALLFTKGDRKDSMVVLRQSDFEKIMRGNYE
jgi:hypothetical protein